ncbi:LuxR family two component transcriptional regulator [Cupriavidus agavae]|uniref:LuxR family two component transcriptional regulator n=2 Tax=Cupriavidus agavae TaxID=1001822 RepID=A0A4Q7RUH2_9BURK|nr:response regulator [Cupriavidus agavae]RZT36707.1 LuxR family two component transcriptional regulator [Cupriavidus agavae]
MLGEGTDAGAEGPDGVVLVVDDDRDMRSALSSLFRSIGLATAAFASGEELLAHGIPDQPTCIVLDVRLRGASGLDLQTHLNDAGKTASIVFISGYGDVPMTVAAMKAGAVNFIAKPFREQDLLDAVNEALQRDRDRRQALSQTRQLRERFAGLTGREQEVMQLLVRGLMNKQVADSLGISQATVKIYRGQAMRKMQARTFAELVIMAQTLGLVKAGDVPLAVAAPEALDTASQARAA